MQRVVTNLVHRDDLILRHSEVPPEMYIVRPTCEQNGFVQIHGLCTQAIVCRIELDLLRCFAGFGKFCRIQGKHIKPIIFPLNFTTDNTAD